MRRKNKKSSNCNLKNDITTKTRPLSPSQECLYIGRENWQRWMYLKTKFNIPSDNEFSSYLLDLFTSEKCNFIKEPPEKEAGESALSVTATLNISEQDAKIAISPPNTDFNKIDHCSSVIVANKVVRTGGQNEEKLSSTVESTCNDMTSKSYSAGVSVTTKQLSGVEEIISDSQESGFHTDVQGGDSCTESQEGIVNPLNGSDLTDQHKTVGNLNMMEKNEVESYVSVMAEECNQNKKEIEIDSNSSSEPNHKKNKKKKVCNVKEKCVAVEEVISKFKKKKVHVNRIGGDPLDKENNDSILTPPMQMEQPDITLSSELKDDLEQRPAMCERVAITIKLCGDCELHHVQDACPLRKPVSLVHDAVTLAQWRSRQTKTDSTKTYAEASLPSFLELRSEGEEEYVVARQPLQAFTQFGPLVGQQIKEKDIPDDSTMEHIWELADSSGCCYMSTTDPAYSNWLRFVRPAPVRSSRNLEVILRDNQLVFVTTTALNTGEELLFWAENTNTAWSQKKLCKTKCGGCNLSFSHTLYYRLHCAVFHDPAYSLTVRKYHCKVCGLSVLGKENIVKHAADSHNGKGAYQCQFCHKFFLRLNYLEMHRTYGCSANPNRARPLCDYCGRKFCQPQKLKVHIKRMHSEMLEVLRDFQCKHCLKVLGSRPALQRHIREVHQKDVVGASTCDRCGKMFQNKSNLKIHMLTHSGVKPFKCQRAECQSAFTTKQCLQFHYRKVHGLEAGHMPLIERSVEYTFDAYSGSRRPNSVNTDSQCSSDGEDTPDKCRDEDSSLSPPISVTGDPMDSLPFEPPCRTVVSKGSKKWMGELTDSCKTTVFDIDENDNDQDINVSHIDEEPVSMLMHQCKQDSTNASLLVEAALDAAEKEIDIPAKICSPVALVTNKEPYSGFRDNIPHSPLSLSRPVSPVDYPIQDQSQSPQLAIDSCYSTSMSPRHPYSLMFPERTPHYDFRLSPPPSQMETFHLDESRYELHRRAEESSGDEGLSEAQNLSLGLKNKVLQLEIPYKYDTLEERGFESVEGLDMSRTSGYHHPFVTPRYPHALYDTRTYSHSDVLRVVNFSHSVDLSLPRSHHQLTPPISQTMIEPIRIMSPPPPPPYQAYPLSTSPYSRPPLSPTYHHYSTTY